MYGYKTPTVKDLKEKTRLLKEMTSAINQTKQWTVTLTINGVITNLVIAVILPEQWVQNWESRLLLLVVSLLLLGFPFWFIRRYEKLIKRGSSFVKHLSSYIGYGEIEKIKDEDEKSSFVDWKNKETVRAMRDNTESGRFPLLKSSTAYVKINLFAFVVVILAMFVRYGNL